jgi:hypothetical protein
VGGLVHILRPRDLQVVGEEREEPRWCFGCRKRLGGTWQLMAEPPPSYYDPHWSYRCDGCGRDRRFFPGREAP